MLTSSAEKIQEDTLTYIRRSHAQGRHCYSIFRCECGKEFVARNDSVKIGRIKSCGCKSNQMRSKTQTIHQPVGRTESGVKKMPEFRQEDVTRFWEKVNCDSNAHHCWDWTTANNGRYGYFNMGGSGCFKANRIAYFLHYDKDPEGLDIRHSCHRPICCNPHHLSSGTKSDNMKDMVESGRWRTGIREKNLSMEQILEIKELSKSGLPVVELSKKFGVHPSTILKTVKRNIKS